MMRSGMLHGGHAAGWFAVGSGLLFAGAAVGQCPGSGSCCAPNGTPGCAEVACCELVCGQDFFCCDVEWDQICADSACAQCSGCECFPDCSLECEAADTPEGEPCGADTNGGCNSSPPLFGTVEDGETICGTAWATGGSRDTDWFVLEGQFVATRIVASAVPEFPAVCYVVDGLAACDPVVIGTPGEGAGCTAALAARAVVPPGGYAIFVASSTFDGVLCGGSNTYRVEVSAICDGDTNRDEVVNVVDIINVVAWWETPGRAFGIDADIDDTGVVDIGDLVTVIRRWGPCAP